MQLQLNIPRTTQLEPTVVTRSAVMMQIACAGCAATATIQKPKRPGVFEPNEIGWSLCGEDDHGALKRWCAQCVFEGRHER